MQKKRKRNEEKKRSPKLKKKLIFLVPVTALKNYTMSEVSKHDQEKDCWMVIEDKVYDLTKFINEHPGGFIILVKRKTKEVKEKRKRKATKRKTKGREKEQNVIKKKIVGW